MRNLRRMLAAAVTTVLVAPLAACTADRPDPAEPAQAFAAAMVSGDFTAVPLTGTDASGAATYWEQALRPVLDLTPDGAPGVEVHDVALAGDEDHATATLAYSWDLGVDVDWEYTTTIDLTLSEGEDGDAWTLAWRPDAMVPGLDGMHLLTPQRLEPERAAILGADDTAIVTERPVYRIGIDKTLVDEAAQPESARALAAVAGLDPETYAAQVAAAGARAFVEAITVRTDDTAGVDVDAARAVPGVRVVDGELPLGPTREFARPLLGRVGEATAEIVESSDGRIRAGDLVGLSGLQRTYDEQLRGQAGLRVTVTPVAQDEAVDADDEVEVFRTDAVDGTPVRLGIDVAVQTAAEAALADTASASGLVAIRPSTGQVLAAAAGPGGDGTSTSTAGRYAPGSTFKVVTALAMLRAGLDADSIVPCTPTITVDGREFGNVPGYPSAALGDVTLRTAIANSCNTAMISQRELVTQQALHDAAADLGLGATADVGVEAFLGSVPAEAGATEHAASMIGQGKVEASVLSMATVAASVAAGARVQPWIVAGSDATQDEGSADGLTPEEAATLRDLMRAVVTEGGAGVLADLPGEVAAKTGTAEVGDGSVNTWMIAFRGDLAVAVLVTDGETGARTAGPVLRAFLEAVPN
ncbi:MAG: penicillin-binding transpeptidase domain-containing protein [Cellulomonadaceae bacterium]